VEEHEQYFVGIKERAEELRPIMQRIARRENIMAERLELEQILSNSERLTARGPNARDDRSADVCSPALPTQGNSNIFLENEKRPCPTESNPLKD
jgi:hypothetical protein